MRNVVILFFVTIFTRILANICSNNVAGRSIFICQNETFDDLSYIPKYIYRIKFISSNIKSVPSNKFVEFDELKSLSMVNCSIENVESFAFVGLSNLRSLNLSRNSLTVIKDNVFAGLTSLKKLDLTYNLIETIEENSFANISNIGYLDLRYNNLTRINAGILYPLSSASTLDLRYNNLRYVSLEIFNDTKVKWIYIGHNQWDDKCWADLTRSLYNRGIYYGENLAFDTLTKDRIAWNNSQEEGQDLLTEEQAEDKANIVREAEGWKKFYETIVQEIADEHQRLDDIDIAGKQSEEELSNRNTEEKEEEKEEEEEEEGFLQYGRKIILWILSACKIFRIDYSSS